MRELGGSGKPGEKRKWTLRIELWQRVKREWE